MEGRLLGALHFRRQAEIGKSFAGASTVWRSWRDTSVRGRLVGLYPISGELARVYRAGCPNRRSRTSAYEYGYSASFLW